MVIKFATRQVRGGEDVEIGLIIDLPCVVCDIVVTREEEPENFPPYVAIASCFHTYHIACLCNWVRSTCNAACKECGVPITHYQIMLDIVSLGLSKNFIQFLMQISLTVKSSLKIQTDGRDCSLNRTVFRLFNFLKELYVKYTIIM